MQNLDNCALFEFRISFQIIYAVYQENYGFNSYPTVSFEKLLGDKDAFSSIMKCFKTFKFKHLVVRIHFSKMKYLDKILNKGDRK